MNKAKMHLKVMGAVCLLFFCVFMFAIPVQAHEPAWENAMLGNRRLPRRVDRVTIEDPVPVVLASFGRGHTAINDAITAATDDMIAEASRASARRITFSYQMHYSRGVVSIVIFGNMATARPRTIVRSVNFASADGTILTVDQAMGVNMTALTARILYERIRMSPEVYYAALQASLDGQAFYIGGSRLVLLFDEFRLSTRAMGVQSIPLLLNNVRSVPLEDYHITADGYNLIMVPLRHVAEGLGYAVVHDSSTRTTRVMHGSRIIVELSVGVNNYILQGGTIERRLEAAPILIRDGADSNTFVPISFFDQIMPLSAYSICDAGIITFVSYLRPEQATGSNLSGTYTAE
jgi:hypothetical protein